MHFERFTSVEETVTDRTAPPCSTVAVTFATIVVLSELSQQAALS